MDYVILNGKRIKIVKQFEFQDYGSLDLSDKKIKTLTSIQGLEKIKRLNTLNLNSNKIKTIRDLKHFDKIDTLYLGDNQIKNIEGLENINVHVLSLSNNKINKITGLNNLRLHVLFLENNFIKKIECLEGQEDLLELYLSNNQITELEGFQDCWYLHLLDLNNNPIKDAYERELLNGDVRDIIKYCKNKEKMHKNIAYRLLKQAESEYLDFKFDIYDILSSVHNKKILERQELLRDILSLLNVKDSRINTNESYLIIGVDEVDEKYNGRHKNINFKDTQIIIQLVQEYIAPSFTIKFEEYFLSGDENNILLSDQQLPNYDRILLIKLIWDLGTVYEIKKEYGDSQIGFLRVGDSFTRDGSHKRRIMETDRIKIRELV